MINRVKTTLLLAVMTVFIVLVGQMLGGRQGMIMAFILAAGMNFFSYWFSDKIVLKMYKAQVITPEQAPELYGIVETLTQRAGLPMPSVCIIPQEAPNAFATGRNPQNAVVAVTDGLLRLMDRDEITGVIAHELAHVKNRDILIGSIAATMAGAIMILASMARWSAMFGGFRGGDDDDGGGIIGVIAMSIIAPIAAMIIQMAVSRSREYLADSTGAEFTGNPEGLARALEKLGAYSQKIPMAASPQTSHMFIVKPMFGKKMSSMFSTHPPLEDRIARLRGNNSKTDITSFNESGNIQSAGRAFWDRLSK
ncbi:MAG: zinc metalloprotease HtpX [Desulfobacterales bacterium]|nr:zinc metalloprotease HtpX [Desulfobacterales bacterium]